MNGSLLIHKECIQSLTDSISNGVHIVQDYSIVHANRISARMHGYNSVSEVIGRDIFSFGIQVIGRETLRKTHDDNINGINTDRVMPLTIKARDGRIFQIQNALKKMAAQISGKFKLKIRLDLMLYIC